MNQLNVTSDLSVQLSEAKWCFATRRVSPGSVASMSEDFERVEHGDLILGRVMVIGQHRGIQLASGRRSELFAGDLVVMPCAARYAPDQFEGIAVIDPEGADMLAGGGCLGKMRARNERIKSPTRVLPLGRLLDRSGDAVNVSQFALPKADKPSRIPVLAVFGTAMNSGKTLATARLSFGFKQAGLRVAALKVTGTGSFGDYNEYQDTGANYVADFTDAGMATTYMVPLNRIKEGMESLLVEAESKQCDVAVVEVADGIFQRETRGLLADPEFLDRVAGIVFACGDAVAAHGGVLELRRLGCTPVALTGMLSCSPMAVAEAQAATGISVLSKDELADPVEAMGLLRALGQTESLEYV
ncbi:hypothetical protein [uncultured Marinobacter sp.]|uniref:hypothetical protein n=1 Tax=uncultured Marinobacter sp. TaxID=187379 RepID=UPI00258BBB98|nr:hypothetical protein [uncultured Marinobacter sp.]